MMDGKIRFRLALGMGTLFAAAGLGVIACGGDDTSVIGGTDSGTDGSVHEDGGGDATTTDGAADASHTDAGDDGGAGSDGSADAGDGSSDAGDAGDSGLGDNSAALAAFETQLATTFCTQLAAQCTSADAGTVNVATCVTQNTRANPVLQGSSNGYNDTTATSHHDIVYDPVEAQICNADVKALDILNLTSPPWKQAIRDCFLVGQGTLGTSALCYESLECAPGLYCKTGAGDAGAFDAGPDGGPPPMGACEPTEDAGTVCATLQADGTTILGYTAGDSCSYLGGPGPQYCEFTSDLSDNNEYCMNVFLADGATCFSNNDCSSSLCDLGTDTCVETTTSLVELCTSY